MPSTYFEPENFQALAGVFKEARLILEKRDEANAAMLDFVAHRILVLASNGMKPGSILAHVLNTVETDRKGKALANQNEEPNSHSATPA